MDDECLLAEVSLGVEDMLRHRAWTWQVRDAEWKDAFGFLWPGPCRCPETSPHPLLFHSGAVVILITDQTKIGMSQLRQGYEALQRVGARWLQLVSLHGITTQTMNLNATLPADRHINLLLWSLILLRPLNHQLVPTHRRATAEERARLRPVKHLPVLRADDAIAQYLALRAGEVVHITRNDGTVYYRLIV